MSRLTCFKNYDIRGKLNEEFNEEVAWLIGRAYAEYFKPQTMVVGSDVRLTSEPLKLALVHGLQDSGVNILDIGLSGTEEVYFAASYLNVDGGIAITASHNPINFNGMKLVGRGAAPINSNTGLRKIQILAENNYFPLVKKTKRGTYKHINLRNEYINHLLSYIDLSIIKPLKLVINSGNCAAGLIIDALELHFNALDIPVHFIKINNTPNGNFPNGVPNPSLPENRIDTSNAVIEHSADIGIAFDGDFDRCFLFDENGQFIEGYYVVGLLAESFLTKKPGAKIIHDSRLIWNTIDIIESAGGIPVMSKTGHSFVKECMRKKDAIYGGEISSHHYFRNFAYSDSGMIPWLLVIELLCLKNKTLNELVNNRITLFPISGEINSTIISQIEAMARIEHHFAKNAIEIDYTDGVSMSFPKWRFNIHLSNTEPSVVRLNVESRADMLLIKEKTQEILKILRE